MLGAHFVHFAVCALGLSFRLSFLYLVLLTRATDRNRSALWQGYLRPIIFYVCYGWGLSAVNY